MEPLLASINATVPTARVVFICDPDDHAEQDAIADAGVPFFFQRPGRYAEKVNFAVREVDESLIFAAADDLDFKPGWLEAAIAKIDEGAEVVGVNDLLTRSREHATHFLMTRRYAERPTIDGKPGPFFEGYAHWNVDDELIATAKHRGVYAYAEDSHVEHLHPMAGKAPNDATYEKGRSRLYADRKLFRKRSRLWAT